MEDEVVYDYVAFEDYVRRHFFSDSEEDVKRMKKMRDYIYNKSFFDLRRKFHKSSLINYLIEEDDNRLDILTWLEDNETQFKF